MTASAQVTVGDGEMRRQASQGDRVGALAPDSLHRALRSLSLVLDALRHALVYDVLRPRGLAWSHWIVLTLVAETPGLTPAQVSAQLDLPRSTLTGVLNGLEHRGLVRRRPDRTDSRKLRLSATRHGSRLVVELGREQGRCWDDLLLDLAGEDRAVVVECARRLAALTHLVEDGPGTFSTDDRN